jgi:hypothetical protein
MSTAVLARAKRAGMAHHCKATIVTSAAILVCIFFLFLVYRDLSAAALVGEELNAPARRLHLLFF